ncbi:CerR family C-terminal domain-containing protein [bacterium]|nr:CerR family C-terminal domain-containing protein [candidate division CSSED10-310 bacterium]
MMTRKDGEATRHRILEAASEIFSRKGYRDATHAEICRLAGTNTAAINYHFGSKEGLYRATWTHVAAQVEERFPLDGGLPADAPAHERLRALIRAFIMRSLGGENCCFNKIRMTEIFNPTGLLDKILELYLEKKRTLTRGILRELLGSCTDEKDLDRCEMSLISQCHFLKQTHPGKRMLFSDVLRSGPDELTEHITAFMLAGLHELRTRRETSAQESRV